MPPILVIADDLSGAAEIAAIAAERGLAAEVHREFDPSSRAEVIAIDTDTRQPSAKVAATKLRTLAAHPAFQRSHVFKKVDSVLRGHPHTEIATLLQVMNRQRAVLVPANPSRGRTIVRGEYLVEGLSLDKTAFASDEDFPRHSSSIESLLHLEGSLPLHVGRRLGPPLLDGIIVPDILSMPDVERAAGLTDDTTLAAGAADFFEAMLDRWHEQPSGCRIPAKTPSICKPALLVCGSRVAWPHRVTACEAAQIPIRLIDGPKAGLGDHGQHSLELVAGLIGIGDDNHPDPGRALRNLGATAAQAIETCGVKTLLVEGGATATAIVTQLGWKRFIVQSAATPGVGFLKPVEDPGAPLLLIKPGSYLWPNEIWQSFCS
jgi:uncharacterized protein YgbK (DUF1537 family)